MTGKGKPRPHRNFTDDQLDRAREMRAEGYGWSRIGARLGCDDETIRVRLDPDFRATRARKYRGPLSMLRVSAERTDVPLQYLPPDTRTRLAKFMGDPLPGRSALDKKSIAARLSPSINTIHTSRDSVW